MPIKNIIITGSIGSLPSHSYGQKTYISSTENQSFPLEQFSGGNAGSLPNLLGQTSSINLFSNISQSWDGINDTIAGYVPFTHNTQDEFINGEFSGSNILVSQQNINRGADFLKKVNSAMVDYKIYFFNSSIFSSLNADLFLNSNTSPNEGELYLFYDSSSISISPNNFNITINNGYKYAKINKVDANGNNNILSLQSLESFAVKFSDLGNKIFPINSITEYPTYFLYSLGEANLGYKDTFYNFISPTNPSSSANTLSIGPGDSSGTVLYGYTNILGTIDNSGFYHFINSASHTVNVSFSASNPVGFFQTLNFTFTGSYTKENGNPGKINRYQESIDISPSSTGVFSASFSFISENNEKGGLFFSASGVNPSSIDINLPSIIFSITSSNSSPITASVDNNILDYIFSASAFTTSSFTLPLGVATSLTGGYSINTDILNYFTSSLGLYNYKDTPNTKIIFSASFIANTGSGGSDTELVGYLSNQNNYAIINTNVVNISSSNKIMTMSGVFNPLENDNLKLTFHAINTSSNPPLISDVRWYFYPNFTSQSSENLIILEPFLSESFFSSPYNILINNATLNEFDKKFMKVNYENGYIIPSNQYQIINRIAEPAPVKPYNYSLISQIRSRYSGVRTESPNFNISSSNDTLPNVEQTTTYFLYFTSLKDTSPIFKDNTSVKIKYIISENGIITNTSTDDVSYLNLIGSFERKKKAYASLLNNTTTIFTQPQEISLSGVSYKPILYSLSSSFLSSASFSNVINFQNLQGTITTGAPDYGFSKNNSKDNSNYIELYTGSNGTYLVNGITNLFYFGTSSGGFDIQSGYTQGVPLNDPTKPYYEFNGVPQTSVNLEVKINPRFWNFHGGSGVSAVTYIRLKLILDRSSTITVLNSKDIQLTLSNAYITPTIPQYLNVNNFYPQGGDKIYVNVEFISGNTSVRLSGDSAGNYISSLKITSNNLTITSPTYPFWTTGSSNSSVLTSSIQLGLSLHGNYRQQDISQSGFDPIDEIAQILEGDEIRFEYDENNSYKIIDVQQFNSSSIAIFLDRFVPTIPSLDINHFVIRRLSKDPISGVTLNAKLTKEISNGFLFAEYPSDNIKNNLNNIIKDLQSKNII